MMQTKLSKLKAMAAAGDWRGALRLAATFPDLGAHEADIKRGHEAHDNARFYASIGRDPEALIAAGIEALKARYKLNEKETEMTNLTALEIAKLSALLTGGGYKRSNTKEAAVARFLKLAAEKGIADAAKFLSGEYDFDTAHHVLFELIKGGHASIPEVKADASLTEELSAGNARKAALAVAEQAAPAPAAKPAKAPKAAKSDKAPGKRAAAKAEAEAAAMRGELPKAPDFSAPTHKAWVKKLAAIVAMVEAGDIAGLKAEGTEPKSSSRMQLCRYRDLAIMALEARAASAKAA